MRGIREAAMSQEEEEVIPTKSYATNYWNTKKTPKTFAQKSFLADDYANYSDPYNPSDAELERDKLEEESYTKEWEKEKENLISIKLFISEKELADEMDIYYQTYDITAAENKAIEIAYDRFKGLLAKDYESTYKSSYTTIDAIGGMEVTLTLINVK